MLIFLLWWTWAKLCFCCLFFLILLFFLFTRITCLFFFLCSILVYIQSFVCTKREKTNARAQNMRKHRATCISAWKWNNTRHHELPTKCFAHGFSSLLFCVCTTLYTKYIQCTFHVVHVVSPSFVSRKWNETPANFERIKMKIKVNQRIFPTSFPTCSHYNFGLLKFTSAKFFSLRLIPIISIHATEKTKKEHKNKKNSACFHHWCAKKDAIRFMLLLVSKYPWIFSVEWKNVRFSASLKRKYQVAFVVGAGCENFVLWIDKGKSMYQRASDWNVK